MKAFSTVVKVLTALAAVAGAVYVVATYGDQIVSWAKKTLSSFPCPKCEKDVIVEEAAEEVPAEEATEEAAAEEAVPEEEPAAEVDEAVIDIEAPVADEADFAE